MAIGSRIRLVRDAARLSQGKLGKLIGVTGQAISQWENDRAEPTSANVRAVAKALGIPISRLTDDSQVEVATEASPTVGSGLSREMTAEEAEAIGRATVRYLVERADEETSNQFVDLLLETIRRKADGAEDSMQSLRSEARVTGALLKVMRRPKTSNKS